MALTINQALPLIQDATARLRPARAATRIFRGGAVGIDPGGYAKPFEPGDTFDGIAESECDNRNGAAGALAVSVVGGGTAELPISGASYDDVGKNVFATADDTYSLVGNAHGFVGRVVAYNGTTGYATVALKGEGEWPDPTNGGCILFLEPGSGYFEGTGATAGTKMTPGGLGTASALGLGVFPNAAAGAGIRGEFDATSEVASCTLRTGGQFSVAYGCRLDCDLVLASSLDSSVDLDWGFGTLLTANSIASIDHADMVNLAAFHMDGASDNILAQSDDNVTDVAPADTTIDNDSTTDTYKRFSVIVRTSGAVEFWIDGARVLSSTTFAIGSTPTALEAFVNMEKTAGAATTAVLLVRNIVVSGGRA